MRVEGLEPPRREALDPKSRVSTNSTTLALFILRIEGNRLHAAHKSESARGANTLKERAAQTQVRTGGVALPSED